MSESKIGDSRSASNKENIGETAVNEENEIRIVADPVEKSIERHEKKIRRDKKRAKQAE